MTNKPTVKQWLDTQRSYIALKNRFVGRTVKLRNSEDVCPGLIRESFIGMLRGTMPGMSCLQGIVETMVFVGTLRRAGS